MLYNWVLRFSLWNWPWVPCLAFALGHINSYRDGQECAPYIQPRGINPHQAVISGIAALFDAWTSRTFYHIMANDSGLGLFSIYYGRIQSLSLLNWGLQSSSQQNGYDKSRRRKLPSEALFSQATSQNFVWFQVHWDVVQINSLTYLLFEAWTTSSVLLIIPHCAIPLIGFDFSNTFFQLACVI